MLVIVFLVLPVCFASRFSLVSFAVGLLVSWLLFGVFIELSLVSCRAGCEPLRSVVWFCIGFILFAPLWALAFVLGYGAMRLLRGIRGRRSRTQDRS